jgi:uncharacterized protein
VILVDVNLLLQATLEEAPGHPAAHSWFGDRLSGTARVGLPWACLTGFVRIAGQPRAWERPVPVADALSVVRAWLARPSVWTPEPGPRHLELLTALLSDQPSAGFVTDAHIAAIALEHGLELCSRDRDFARWSAHGLRSSDPLA